ncbi:MAG: hypothetical protein PUH93_02860 [Clostridia bacterium]|nr:hypothetical protein [Clostridia bacterium]
MAKKGFIARMIEGPERSETYAASTLPTNRWQLGWDVFKTNTGKHFKINLLTLVFLLPFIAICVLTYMYKLANVDILPFTQNMAIGYPSYPSTFGLSANLALAASVEFFKFLIVGILVGAVGLSGGFYVMRNMVWAEGVIVGSDFFKGVKQNYFVVLFSLLFYGVIMGLSVISVNMAQLLIDTCTGIKWLLVSAQVLTYIIMGIVSIMVLYMITLGVTYKLSFGKLIKNSFILTIGLIPTNVFFAFLAALPFLLFSLKVSMLMALAIVLVFVWGFSIFMLIWTDYSNWVFDRFINDKVPGAKKNRGIYKPNATEEDGEQIIFEKTKLNSSIKPITDYDVELYELPESFSRKDLQKLEETKEAMRRDSDKYAEEHGNDDKKPETIDDLMKDEEPAEGKKPSQDKSEDEK